MLNFSKLDSLNRLIFFRMKPTHLLKIVTLISFFVLNLFVSPLSANGTDESNFLIVSSINITGNTKTRMQVIRSMLDFRVGDAINQARLEKNIDRFKASNFFKHVNIYTQPGEERGYINVFIEVKERRWPFFQFKSGFNELDGWYISPLGLRFDNMLGRGNFFGAEFLIGDRVIGLDISYQRPRIMQSDLNLRVNLFSRSRQFVHYIDEEKFIQTVADGGLSVQLNGNHGVMKYLWIEVVKEVFDAKEYLKKPNNDEEFPLPAILESFSGKKEVGRIILSLSADTRDQVYYPMRGWWGSIALNQVSTDLGAFANYKKMVLDVRRYQSIIKDWIIAARLRGGWIDDDAPFYEKFYLGGPNSVRGYKDRSLNPLGYASRLVQGGVELRFPLTHGNFPRHFLTGILFYDIGEAWSEPDEFDSKTLESSLGYGLRLNLPVIGLLRLDFAYPIPDYELRVHLSLGHTF